MKRTFLLLLFLSTSFIDLVAQIEIDPVETKINALWDEGELLNNKKKYVKAKEKLEEAKKLWENNFILDIQYTYLLSYLGSSLNSLNLYKESLPIYQSISDITKEILGDENHEFANSLLDLAYCYEQMGTIPKSLALKYRAHKIRAEINGEKHHKGAHSVFLGKIANEYKAINQYKEAIIIYTDALQWTVKDEGVDSSLYLQYLDELVKLTQITNNYSNLIPIYEEQLEHRKETLGEEHPRHMVALNNLIFAYTEADNLKEAFLLSEKHVALTKLFYGEEHLKYASAIDKLGTLNKNLGDFDKAKIQFEKALFIKKKFINESPKSYLITLNNLALLEGKISNNVRALELFKEALELAKKTKNQELNYLTIQNNIATVYIDLKEYDNALKYCQENLKEEEKLFGKKHIRYATVLNNLAIIQGNLENYDEAIRLTSESLSIILEVLGEESLEYSNVLSNLAQLYAESEDYDKAIELYAAITNRIYKKIDNNFTFLSLNQKEIFLKNSMYLYTVSSFVKSLNYKTKNRYPDLVSLSVNYCLNEKGLILNSSKQILHRLKSLHNGKYANIVDRYREILEMRNKFELVSGGLNNQDDYNLIESLRYLENSIIDLYSESFNDEVFKIKNWKSVELRENELAIEFDYFNYITNDVTGDVFYVAYLFKKEWDNPVVVYLFEEKELKELYKNENSINSLYTKRGSKGKSINVSNANVSKVYNLIWKPLENYVKDKTKIYYAPSGLLHKVPFAALQNQDDQLLSEMYNLNQISTSVLLNKSNQVLNIEDVLLIGGVNYNSNIQSNDEVSVKNNAIGAAWNFLPGTLNEVNLLSEKLDEKSIKHNMLIGDMATEEKFKSLSGSSPKVIHLATHGYFFNNIKKEREVTQGVNGFKESDNPLVRSGLILAGANDTWQHGRNPYEEEDGILTALEISNLDLSNTDMVVLSACETGLGDIDGSEGVYGLQRAFKMAGVDIIVMSLWEVPDIETAEFMNSFYNNWLGGMQIREAFRNTQRTMSTKYKDTPDKWAAFVLFE